MSALRLAYADPPYTGCAHLYKNHPDFAGEVDHAELIHRLETEYDGFILHTTSGALWDLLPMFASRKGVRVMGWFKPFAVFKRNVPVAYAWEPCIVKAARKPVVNHREVMRDWIEEEGAVREGITTKKGLTGYLDGVRVGTKRAGRVLDGRTWDEFPASLSSTSDDSKGRTA